MWRYDIFTCEDIIYIIYHVKISCEDIIYTTSSHVKISMISVISRLSLKLYLNSLVYHRNIFGSPSKVFGNLRISSGIFGNSPKMFENVCLGFGTILENLRKSSVNHQKHHHQYAYIIKRTLHVSSKIWILCSRGIKFISFRHRVISSIYVLQKNRNTDFLKYNTYNKI